MDPITLCSVNYALKCLWDDSEKRDSDARRTLAEWDRSLRPALGYAGEHMFFAEQVREAVFRVQSQQCAWAGGWGRDCSRDVTIDHIKPLQHMGTNYSDNL